MTIIKDRFFTLGGLAVLLLFVLYVVITFITPQSATSREQFGISDNALLAIRLSIIAIYAVVWFSAFYCARTFKLVGQRDASLKPLTDPFSFGFLLLLIGTITTTFLGSLSNYSNLSLNEFIPMLTIITNYVHVIFPLLAFFIIWYGFRKLKVERISLGAPLMLPDGLLRAGLPVALVGIIYIALIFTNPNRQIPFNLDTPATYYISDPLIIITIILPVLLAWFFGIAVALRSSEVFSQLNIKRTGSLTNGILLIIFSSIFLQVILSLGSERLFGFGLWAILLMVYILLFTQMAGYLFAIKGIQSFEDKDV